MKLYGLFSYTYDWDSEYEDLVVVSDSTDKLENIIGKIIKRIYYYLHWQNID